MKKMFLIKQKLISKVFVLILLLSVGVSFTAYAWDPIDVPDDITDVPEDWAELDGDMPPDLGDPTGTFIRSVQPVVTYNFIITYLDNNGNAATLSTRVQTRLDVYRAYIRTSQVQSVEFILM